MRRESDRQNGERTGTGRRARDKIMSGQPELSPALSGRHELANLVLFLGDDLRESAIAVSGIESFLFKAQELLAKPNLGAEELRALVEDPEIAARIDLLSDALSSLTRSMSHIHHALK
jgi:hypothetical protein